MSFTCIHGTFHVKGYSPDGDSVRFRASNRAHWGKLSGPPVKLNAREHAQLRLEAIDTLETHFLNTHQPLPFADAAVERLLEMLGITGVTWNPQRTLVADANDATPGYILSRAVERNQRPVAFAFAGASQHADGSTVHLDPPRLRQSVNWKQMREGFAYPTYYKGLFADLRAEMTAAAQAARTANANIWSADATNGGFDVQNPATITTQHVILPKLFRRLAEYFEAGGSIGGFLDFLDAKNDAVTIISQGHFTSGLDAIVEVQGTRVRLTEPPENLMFDA